MRCWRNSELFYDIINSLYARLSLDQLTESITERLCTWHHVFETQLVGRRNLVEIKVA
jgi:hypothetical protein